MVVEHDREVIDSADHVLDFGPGAGAFGGRITAAGSPKQIRSKRASLTGRYLANKESIPVPINRRPMPKVPPRTDLEPVADELTERQRHASTGHSIRWLNVHGAREHNLKEIDVAFPLGRFTCITGVSGSGKSTLVSSILYAALAARIHRARIVPGGHERITGIEHVDKVINVDQSPIGNSPTSNPATYTGVFDAIRELFTKLPLSKIRGYTANRFSFNRPGGRCEACAGMGQRCIEMHFLPDVWVECDSCNGHRYVPETLEVRYRGKSIADVLDMRVADALELCRNVPKVKRMLKTLDDVGLGYVQLGQPAPTLSGGEAQRVKLAAELGRPSTGKTLYILDEPTTGLHFDDLKKLLAVLHRLVDLGNTCICIEHNLDVIKTADWIIDLGPEAGEDGGDIVVAGTPERVAAARGSRTGAALKPLLEAGPVAEREVYQLGRRDALDEEQGRPIEAGGDVQMPWERDGRAWHTVDHLDGQGNPAEWDPQLLIWLVETMESLGKFAPTDWNHRTRIEITAAKDAPWFAHVLTGGKDLLEITLRVAQGVFQTQMLLAKLGVKTLDERADLPIYGQWSRVRVRPRHKGWDEVRLSLRDFKDVSKARFRTFLQRAVTAYFKQLEIAEADPSKATPWKTQGKQYHLSQQGISKRHVTRWKPMVLMAFIGRLKSLQPDLEVSWNHQTAVQLLVPGEKRRAGKIVTNIGRALRIELLAPKGLLTPTQIDRLGEDPRIRHQSDYDRITFWIRSPAQNDVKQLREVWRRCREADVENRLQTV
jgi:excinuclease ABC subunit A